MEEEGRPWEARVLPGPSPCVCAEEGGWASVDWGRALVVVEEEEVELVGDARYWLQRLVEPPPHASESAAE